MNTKVLILALASVTATLSHFEIHGGAIVGAVVLGWFLCYEMFDDESDDNEKEDNNG